MLGIVTQAQRVQARLQSLARLNIDLAKVEGRRKAIALGIAVGLGVGAAVLVFYAVGFIFAAAAAALNESLPLWASLLVVALVILVVAAVLGLLAARFAKQVSGPEPTPALDEAKSTVETIRSHA